MVDYAADAETEPPPDALIRAVARSIPARFAAADFALSRSGRWLLIEVGEGQVSSVPEATCLPDIFRALAAKMSGASCPRERPQKLRTGGTREPSQKCLLRHL